MKVLALALIIHLAAIITDMQHSQAQTDEYWEMQRKVSIIGLEFVRPLAITLEAYHRHAPSLARSSAELHLMRETADLTLKTLFTPGLRQCIDLLRGGITEYSHCKQAWLGAPSQASQESNIELCNLHLQGMFSDCFSKGWIEFNYREQ